MNRKWKTAFLTILDYRTMDSVSVMESLRRLGYEGIEWTMDPHFDPDKPIEDLRALVNRTRDAGMDVSQIMAHEDRISLDHEARKRLIDRIARTIDAVGQCGVPAVSVLTGPAIWEPAAVRIGEDMSESAAWKQTIETFNTFLEAAEASNVLVTSEAVYGMLAHDFYTHKWLVKQTDRPAHRVNFDPSHHVLYGIEDMRWLITQGGEFVFPLLGEGRVNWKQCFEALEEIGYDGFCSLEFESFRFYRQVLTNDPEAVARILLKQLNALLQER